jgi:hypothetical protein
MLAVLSAFRETDAPVQTAEDVADAVDEVSERDARAALEQLEKDGLLMSSQVQCGIRFWWFGHHFGGDTLPEARRESARQRGLDVALLADRDQAASES